ncbi:MAG: proteinase inhibitor I4 serpin, partial [Lachnospiraceae bacterium]|nr:proteinase inhibitor I4 serpin [Lachnospiraceae bacterium]
DEKGTKAGAATAVVMLAGAAGPPRERIVRLNRPFVYMLIDTETNTPFFIGVLNTPDPEHP